MTNQNIQPVSGSLKINGLIFADPSAGKTSLLTSSAKEYKTLIIRPPLDHIPARALDSGAEQWVVRSWEDMDEVVQWYQHEGDSKDIVCLDSISGWQDRGLDDIWDATVALRPDRADKTVKGGLDKGEYGRNMERIGQWIRHMVGADQAHFFVTAWPFLTTNPFNENAAVGQLWPWVQGKNMHIKIAGYMNFAGYYELRKYKEPKEGQDPHYRRLHTALTDKSFGKDQFDAFPKGYVDNPTMATIIKAVEAKTGVSALPSRGGRGRGTSTTTGRTRGRGRS